MPFPNGLYGVGMTATATVEPAGKRKLFALLLWLFLGVWGGHDFYAGKKWLGVAHVLLFFAWLWMLFFGVLMVKTGRADGMVSGACHSTGDVLRPSLQILKTAPGVKLVSSFFIMVVPNCEYGQNGTFLFSDCGLEIQPDAEKLAHIAVNSAQSWKTLIGTEPVVAMLSHSTYGSAKNDDANKVVEAAAIARELAPELALDGELQADAAMVPSVGASKAPDSKVAGKANCLIFPDLDAGNIGYKLVQRLAHAEAFGPVTQGIAAPVNDLSRGCSAHDIVGVIAITCVQAQAKKAADAQ